EHTIDHKHKSEAHLDQRAGNHIRQRSKSETAQHYHAHHPTEHLRIRSGLEPVSIKHLKTTANRRHNGEQYTRPSEIWRKAEQHQARAERERTHKSCETETRSLERSGDHGTQEKSASEG